MNGTPKAVILVSLALACGHGEQQADFDTSMVFIAAPPPSALDSARAPSRDSLIAVLERYREGRVTADQAAVVVVDYVRVYPNFNADIDDRLQRAISREFTRRANRQ